MKDYNEYSGEERQHPMKVSELAPDDRPRERGLKFGIGSLTNAELLALILRTGSQGHPITELCKEIMAQNGNLFLNLERRSRQEIMLCDGIGEMKAQQVEAIMEIVRRYNQENLSDRVKVTSADTVYDIMKPKIGNLAHEEIWAILLNRANRVIWKERVSEGGAAATVFDAKKVFRIALINRAEGIILCHNHPSGNLRPSPQDDNLTRNFREACRTMDINLLDHLIITTGGYYSYKNESSLLN